MKSKLVKKRARKKGRKSNLFTVLLGFLFIALLATLYIWQRMETIRLVRELGKLENKIAEMKNIREYLATEVQRLSSPQEIQPKAERLLGLCVTDINRQLALADPSENTTLTEKWQNLLADLKHYGKKAWELAEPQALAKEQNE